MGIRRGHGEPRPVQCSSSQLHVPTSRDCRVVRSLSDRESRAEPCLSDWMHSGTRRALGPDGRPAHTQGDNSCGVVPSTARLAGWKPPMGLLSALVTGMSGPPELFRQAVEALKSVRPRDEVELTEVRAPQRLAPWSF